MANSTLQKIANNNADPLIKSGQATESILKGQAEVLTESGNASKTAVQELAKAYQDLATKNAKNLTAAIQRLSVAKNPVEFIELLAQLTSAVFTAAFEPVKKQIEAAQKTART